MRPGGRHRLFTWRNAILGGVAAFALLGLVTGIYLAMRSLGIGPAGTLVAKGILEERERILVADFASASGDEGLATAVTQALRVDLSQSPTVVLVEQDRVATVLERMDRPPDEGLDFDLAREVALRDGIKAVVRGQVDAAGSGFVLTASLVAAEDGEVLASAREAAGDADEVIGAIDGLSGQLRERIGESLRSIRRTAPLEHVTTGSLEALRYYSQAERAHLMLGETDRAIALLDQALEADTAFAMAWRKLGVLLANRGEERSRSVAALEMALAHADRLPERERFLTRGSYFQTATGEGEKAITAYENLLELDPNASFALHNLAVAYAGLRDFARAEELYRAAIAIDSSALSLRNLARTQASQGKWEEAAATQATMRQHFPENPLGLAEGAAFAAARRDFERAERLFEELRREHAGSLYWRGQGTYGLASLASVRGRLARAEELFQEARASAEARDLPAEAIRAATYIARIRILVAGDTAGGLARLADALERHAMDSLAPLDRPWLEVADAYAVAGRPERASEILAAFEREVPTLVQSGYSPKHHLQVRGEIALAEGRPDEAAAAFREADVGFCTTCALPGLARAHAAAGRGRQAIDAYERYLEADHPARLGWVGVPIGSSHGDWLFLGHTYERLGQLHEEAGNLEEARLYYAKITELWADADPELQPRVEAARARLEALLEASG